MPSIMTDRCLMTDSGMRSPAGIPRACVGAWTCLLNHGSIASPQAGSGPRFSKSPMSVFKWILSLSIFDDFPDPVFCKGVSGHYLYSNQAHRAFFGVEETRPPYRVRRGVQTEALCRRSDQEAYERGEPVVNIEFLKDPRTGQEHPFEVHKIPVRGKDRRWLGLIGVIRGWESEQSRLGIRDPAHVRAGVVSHPEGEPGLRSSEAESLAGGRWAQVGQHLNRPIYILEGPELQIVACNSAAAEFAARPASTLVGRSFVTLFADLNPQSLWNPLGRVRARHRTGQGEERPVEVEFKRMERPDRAWGFAVLEDLTRYERHASHWREQLLCDWRTGLPGRSLWAERLRPRLNRMQEDTHAAALFLIEVEEWQTTSGRDGLDLGDRLFQAVAARIRALASPEDLIGMVRERVFGLYVEPGLSREGLERFAFALVQAIGRPHVVDGLETAGLAARVGITMLASVADHAFETIVHQADLALRTARQSGQTVVHFEEGMSLEGEQRRRICEGFAEALHACKPFLAYQPIVDMTQGTLYGFEGLIRWREDEHRQWAAEEFISSVDADPALARELGRFVLLSAAQHIEQWSSLGFEGSLSINIGPRHFLSEHFLNDVGEALERVTRDRDRLVIEITESGSFTDLSRARVLIETLQSWGIRVMLDDFGTGNASLVHLRELPVNGIKIDKRFVQDLIQDDKALWIVSSLLIHAQSQGLVVIAEGVENDSVGTLLLELGCQLAQGYYIGRPLMAWDIPNWLAKWAPPPRWRRRHLRPWPLTNLDGMAAGFSHLRWVEEIRHALIAGDEEDQALEQHLRTVCDRTSGDGCRLGSWLRYSVPTDAAGHPQPLLPRIAELHAGIHAEGLQAVSVLQTGDRKRALRHVEEKVSEPTHELLNLLVTALAAEDQIRV